MSAVNGLAKVCQEYQERFCALMSRGAFLDIKAFMENGMDGELIILAIEKAVQRGAAWSYARRIIENCVEKEILTKDAYEYRMKLKQTMQTFKRNFPYNTEDELLPFVLIEIHRKELEDIERRMQEYVSKDHIFDIDDFVDPD